MGTVEKSACDPVMIGLFRQELAAQIKEIDATLAEWGQGLPPERIDTVIHAFRAVKGAARVVGLPLIMGLAYAAEDYLSAFRQAGTALSAPHVDQLLQAVRIFHELQEQDEKAISLWMNDHEADVRLAAQALRQSQGGGDTSSPIGGPVEEIGDAAFPFNADKSGETVCDEMMSPALVFPAATEDASPPEDQASALLRDDVRSSLSRVAELAGECLLRVFRLREIRPSLLALVSGRDGAVAPAPPAVAPAQEMPSEEGLKRSSLNALTLFDQALGDLESLAGQLNDAILDGLKGPLDDLVKDFPDSPVLIHCLIVQIGGEAYALPVTFVGQVVEVPSDSLILENNRPFFLVEDKKIDLIDLGRVLHASSETPPQADIKVVIGTGQDAPGFVVEAFLGDERLIPKPLDPRLGKVDYIPAAAVRKDGSPVLILDAEELHLAHALRGAGTTAGQDMAEPDPPAGSQVRDRSCEKIPWPFWRRS